MKLEESIWSEKLVLVCRKCGEREGRSNCADDLRTRLKDELKGSGHWGKTRVVGSTCLDLCPEGRVAVAVCEDTRRRLYHVDPEKDYSQILETIKQ